MPSTAAEIRALADQAEVEAAEAEALAAAARARARAMQLRRQAELAEARSAEAATAVAKQETPAELTPAQDAPEAVANVDNPDTDTPDAEAPAAEAPDADKAVASADAETLPETEDKPALRVSARPRLSGRFRRPKWSTVAAGLAVVVTLAALAGSGYMSKQHHDAVLKHQRATEFDAAARHGVVTLTSLDFNNAKQGVQRIIENSTGSFKDDFLKTADDFTKVVEQSKVVSQSSVQASAVDLDTLTNDSAVVLVAATQEVTNAAGAKRDPRNYRLIVTVARDGDQLKLSKVEFVP